MNAPVETNPLNDTPEMLTMLATGMVLAAVQDKQGCDAQPERDGQGDYSNTLVMTFANSRFQVAVRYLGRSA